MRTTPATQPLAAAISRAPMPQPIAPRPTPARTARTLGVDPLLTPAEVASLFRVDPKTVTRWANAGKISTVRTLGGHRRFSESEVRTLLGAVPSQRPLV